MGSISQPFFTEVPRSARGHFALMIYAAIQRLIEHLDNLPEHAGDSLREKFVFLSGYSDELTRQLPEGVSGHASQWWRMALHQWEGDGDRSWPWRRLAERAIEDFDRRLIVALVGLVEEDSRFGTVFQALQSPLPHRRPTIELVGQILGGVQSGQDAWTLCAPLLEQGWLVCPNREAPRAEWVLRVPTPVWSLLRGDTAQRVFPGCEYLGAGNPGDIDELIFSTSTLDRLHNLPPLLADLTVTTLVLRADPGTDSVEVARAIAAVLGKGLLLVRSNVLEAQEAIGVIGPLATLLGAILSCEYELGPGDTTDPPALNGYQGPIMLLMGLEGGLHSRRIENSLTLELPRPNGALRQRWWQRALGKSQDTGVEALSERFHLSGKYITTLAKMARSEAALHGDAVIGIEAVHNASRALNRQYLDTLADRLDACGSWAELIVSNGTSSRLSELTRRCQHRERLQEHLSNAFVHGLNCGVRSLFIGPSGTGKTLAARILAAELGMDVYRVDLAAVINKYIGETEKNLHRVLTRAEALDVILLLDEGDALLSRRSEVRSSNDRYANLETNYLLQRLEHYNGIVIVTTNLGENIDPAFERRMDIVVPFMRPVAEERARILDGHLPETHVIDRDYLNLVATKCDLTGGQFRNAVMHAVLHAIDEDQPLERSHLDLGLRSEYRKAGAAYPLREAYGTRPVGDNGTVAFGAALQRARSGWIG
jgi:hypothetical protein